MQQLKATPTIRIRTPDDGRLANASDCTLGEVCRQASNEKPIALVVRALLACTKRGGLVLDPFAGSATTGIAANLIGRRFVGIEQAATYLEISRRRRIEMDARRCDWAGWIPDLVKLRGNEFDLRGKMME